MGKHLSVRVDDDLLDLIEREQERTPYNIPTSEIVRSAVRHRLTTIHDDGTDCEDGAEGDGGARTNGDGPSGSTDGVKAASAAPDQ